MYSVVNYFKIYKLVNIVHVKLELTATDPKSCFQGPVALTLLPKQPLL